jgi:GTP-binding protein
MRRNASPTLKATKRNREGVKKTERKVAAKEKAIRRGHATPATRADKGGTTSAKPAKRSKFAKPVNPKSHAPGRPRTFGRKDEAVPPPALPERKRPARASREAVAAPLLPPPSPVRRPATAHRQPVLAIVGRPNVGKSTLFNRLTESRRSIVGDEPGITRDRIYGEVTWAGRTARIVDTGGIVPDDPDLIPAEIFAQARVALDEADVIVMIVDGRTELASPDFDLAKLLLRSGKSIILAVNKIDTESMEAAAENYRRLGIRHMVSISAEHSHGIGDLLDQVFDLLPFGDAPTDAELEAIEEKAKADDPEGLHRTHGEFEPHETRVAIIGRPNVGKSTLLNAMTGTSRAIVSPIAGTTRDAVDEVMDYKGSRFRIIDTAGIRRKGKTNLMAEKLSVVMARRHLEEADVALLIIDATEGVTSSDATIGGYAHESGRSVIIVVNKWDLVTTNRTDDKPPADPEIFETQVRNVLKYLAYAPVVFISAAEGKHINKVLDLVVRVASERRKRVTTGQMNRFLERVDFQRATVPMASRMRIYYMTQAAVAPPTFVLFTNRQVKLHFSFERFLENQIRQSFGFEGSPIWFKVRARNEKALE